MVIRIVLVSAAFQLRKVDGGAWESVANMTLLAAAGLQVNSYFLKKVNVASSLGLQLGAGMLALYYTDQISSTRFANINLLQTRRACSSPNLAL